jgi:hypothetical protein
MRSFHRIVLGVALASAVMGSVSNADAYLGGIVSMPSPTWETPSEEVTDVDMPFISMAPNYLGANNSQIYVDAYVPAGTTLCAFACDAADDGMTIACGSTAETPTTWAGSGSGWGTLSDIPVSGFAYISGATLGSSDYYWVNIWTDGCPGNAGGASFTLLGVGYD